jgi:hypothetical protein
MSSPSQEQVNALADLIGELNAASEITLGKRMVPGREPGFYSSLAETGQGRPLGPGGFPMGSRGGKRRRRRSLRGGAACDNQYVSLAIDSAIILAGAAAIAGTGYAGFSTLQYFMGVYALDASVVSVVTALFNSFNATLSFALTSGSSVVSAVGPMASSAASAISIAASSASSTTGPVLTTLFRMGPAVLLGRYIGTGISAREDAMAILNGLNAKYESISNYAGAVTRSVAAKKAALEQQIAETRERISQTYQAAAASAQSTSQSVSSSYGSLKGKLCELVDKVAAGVISSVDIMPGLEDAVIVISGGRKRKTRKNRNTKKHKKRGHKSHRRR